MYTGEYYYEEEHFKLIKGDTFRVLKKFKDRTIDIIFADPPYFLSNDGITCSAVKMVAVNKGKWDKATSLKYKHNLIKSG